MVHLEVSPAVVMVVKQARTRTALLEGLVEVMAQYNKDVIVRQSKVSLDLIGRNPPHMLKVKGQRIGYA